MKFIRDLLLMLFAMLAFFAIIGYGMYMLGCKHGQEQEASKWRAAIIQMEIDCQHAPQPVQFPNGKTMIIHYYPVN